MAIRAEAEATLRHYDRDKAVLLALIASTGHDELQAWADAHEKYFSEYLSELAVKGEANRIAAEVAQDARRRLTQRREHGPLLDNAIARPTAAQTTPRPIDAPPNAWPGLLRYGDGTMPHCTIVYLVPLDNQLPAEDGIGYFGAPGDEPLVGCNSLVCLRCKALVKDVGAREINQAYPPPRETLEALYESPDPGSSPLLDHEWRTLRHLVVGVTRDSCVVALMATE